MDEDVTGDQVTGFILLSAAVGSLVGVGADAWDRKRQVIHQRQLTSAVQVGVAPLLTRQRQGVQVTLRF